MPKAIEQIVAGYIWLKNRVALEEMREHRKRLLTQHRALSASGLQLHSLTAVLQDEIGVVEAALTNLEEGEPSMRMLSPSRVCRSARGRSTRLIGGLFVARWSLGFGEWIYRA